jgi:hypothetical protein
LGNYAAADGASEVIQRRPAETKGINMQPEAMMRPEALAQMRRRVVISSTIGNALERFDFTVFGLFAGIIGKLFFSS